MQVYCDFDGTISIDDATDFVLARLAEPEWMEVEQKWLDGEIGSGERMRREIALLRAGRRELDEVLDDVVLDPTFPDFVHFCRSHGVPITVVSDSVDYFIKRILARHGLVGLEVIANRLSIETKDGRTRYAVSSPYADTECQNASGVCTCNSITRGYFRVFIGDGHTDFCVAHRPEVVFAKGLLADYCFLQEIPFFAYQTFDDLTSSLQEAYPTLLKRHTGTIRSQGRAIANIAN